MRALLWSALNSLLLCLLLILVFLIVDLLETRGQLFVPRDAAEAVAALSGRTTGTAILRGEAERVVYENTGLLPAVWRTRRAYWNPALAAVYRGIPWLQRNGSALALLVVAAVVLGFVRTLISAHVHRLSDREGWEAATRLRRAIHRQRLRLGPSDVEEAAADQALDLFTTDVDRVRDGVAAWSHRWGTDPLRLVLLLWLALSINWLLTLQCLIPLACCWYVAHRQIRRSGTAQAAAHARADAELRLLAESLRKSRLVRGYGMENYEHEQFQTHLDRFRDSVLTVRRGERLSRWTSRMLFLLSAGLVLFLVGVKALQPPDVPFSLSLSAGLLLAGTFFCMWRPLESLVAVRGGRAEAALAADRIHRYLDRIPEVGQAVGAKFLQPLARAIQFQSVTYALPGRRVLLDRLDLKMPAGASYAVISLDALEPRAFAYLLPRFIEPQSGHILFDGEDIAWVTLESLRAESAYVGGSDPFFTGTVRENIRCGDAKYTLQDVTEAAKLMHANQFILKLPQGYETVLGEHGEQLDAGQGFRLGLTRAVLRKPALLIIEEPAETLDDDTKAALDDAYTHVARDRTVIFLPTRLSTVRRCDRIILLNRGKVEAIGSHADLVKASPLYRHWEYIRFNQFRTETE